MITVDEALQAERARATERICIAERREQEQRARANELRTACRELVSEAKIKQERAEDERDKVAQYAADHAKRADAAEAALKRAELAREAMELELAEDAVRFARLERALEALS